MKKRVVLLTLCIAVAFSLTGCGLTDKLIGVLQSKLSGSEEESPEIETTERETEEFTEEETEEETEEFTEEHSEAPVVTAAVVPGELSTDIRSHQISIDGVVYTFPLKYSELVSTGWVLSGSDSQTLQSQAYTSESFAKSSEIEASFSICNFGINEAKYSDCYIVGVSIASYYVKPEACDILLPGGLQYGVATTADADAAYGTPDDLYEGDYSTAYTYGDYQEDTKLTFDAETGLLDDIEVRNIVEPSDFEAGEVDTTVPDITLKYQEPSAVGKKITDYAVEFDGDLYQLPAPVSAFIANGWEIDTTDSELVAPGQGFAYITLKKNGQSFRPSVYNYSPNATPVENGFITRLKADDYVYGCNVNMKLTDKIYTGMKEADLVKELKNYIFEKTDGSSYVSYDVEDAASYSYGASFIVTDGIVSTIEVTYDPRYSDYRLDMGLN